MDIAVHRVINWGNILGITRDWGVRHDGVGIWRLIYGLQLQPLMMNPKVRGFDVLGIPFVFMRTIHGFAGSSLPLKGAKQIIKRKIFMDSYADRELLSVFPSSTSPNHAATVLCACSFIVNSSAIHTMENAAKALPPLKAYIV